MSVVVAKILSQVELQHALEIRRQVFVLGQKVPLDEEVDGKDTESEHYLLTINKYPVGTTRVRFVGDYAKIERVAILETYQDKGLGRAMMEHIMADLRDLPQLKGVKLSSQSYAIPFYERLGFSVCSEEYLDAGIPHKDMLLKFQKT